MTPNGTWSLIAERMSERQIPSEYGLAQLLAEAGGRSFETTRTAVGRWKRGKRPGAAWSRVLAQVLGGEPADYSSPPTGLRLVSSREEVDLDDLREELVSATAALWVELKAVRTRVERLEAGRGRRSGGQVEPRSGANRA